jgi:hypothetical protein
MHALAPFIDPKIQALSILSRHAGPAENALHRNAMHSEQGTDLK